jgi:hypothetical protein
MGNNVLRKQNVNHALPKINVRVKEIQKFMVQVITEM